MSRISIQKRFFFHIHPLAATGYFAGMITLLLLFNHVSIVLTAFLLIIFLNWFYLGIRKVERQLKFNCLMFLTIVVFNLFLNQGAGPYLWQTSILGLSFKLSYPALLYGSVMGLMLVEMLMAFALFNSILTTNKLLAVFSPVSPRLALLVVLSINLVNTFNLQFKRLVLYQKTRNVDPFNGSIRKRLSVGMHFLGILLEGALVSGMERARSMDARGFGATKRSHYRIFKWQFSDSFFMTSSLIIFLALIGFKVGSFGWTNSALKFNGSFSVADGWILCLLGLFLLIPVISEKVADLWTN
ncbi:energy-coupling factor transporter transmembrane component T [Lentilactobacillus hilgardii]|uniref:energy-coupling factor transporter transmembrane component T n=1 Tax=Lentilactobacillus hilgardii TaxID=1588 RepID=UPI0021A5908C|nr:energy-coupling factor transporter transmembrane component T [Lentilactobacillus hilgardii]MCT3398747.1 ABC transporter [Lentilactobacillus hilgardii]